MVIGVITIKIYSPWVHSLKEKRMIVKSICAKTRNKFNVSIIEAEEQDIHQIIVLGIASIADNSSHADSTIDNVLRFVESNIEGDIINIEREYR
ncbi:MAG: hypothetical protein K0R15_1548 [Clostridiales bacterium]|jgi:uncharacterized protein YlxP (DUF503 family)|nr:hypothetical protein [Clostridiales bacterium]